MLRSLLLAAVCIVLVPAAAHAQAMDHSAHAAALPADSLVGPWSYTIDTPDGGFTGRLVIEKAADGALSAQLTGDAVGAGGLPVRGFAFDGHKMTGTFTNPSYGDIGFTLAVTGRTFAGEFTVLAMGAAVPASGRKL